MDDLETAELERLRALPKTETYTALYGSSRDPYYRTRQTPPDRAGTWFEIFDGGDWKIIKAIEGESGDIMIDDGLGAVERGTYRQLTDAVRWQGPIRPLPDVTPF